MNVDHPQTSGSNHPLPPLTHQLVDRSSRHEREDKDLVPEPVSPELSESKDEVEEDESLDPDEPDFLSDNEESPLSHTEILAMEQLTAGFQLHAARAGILLAIGFLILYHPHFACSTGTVGP